MSQPEPCWYIRTPIQQGEIFSSWLIRSALDVGCSPMVLIEALWGKWRALTIDLDKGVDAERFDALLSHSIESKQNIQQSMLSSVVSEIHPNFDSNQNIPWVLSLGTRNRSNTSGRQVCVECLKSHENPPYLRLMWRIGWHCSCVEHQVSLIDHCPECGVTIQPFKADMQHGCLAICTTCGFDLRHCEESQKFNLNALKIIQKLLKTEKAYSLNNEFFKEPEYLSYRDQLSAKTETNFQMEEYYQSFSDKYGYLKNLSIIDLLCNKGPEALTYIKNIKTK